MAERVYLCIDLKSFYASVECVERGLDPLTTNLVVADRSRTQKTICLAVSPALKMYGIPGRPRLFEVEQKVREINASRKEKAPYHCFLDSSYDSIQLREDVTLSLDYITAVPRMALYLEYSTKIYGIYLNYIAPEDMHVYSIDEVFFDVTNYLDLYQLTAYELAMKMIKEVFCTTGITATAGVGTNMYLCKVAMDIVAKHTKPDKEGVRIAELDEMSYRRKLRTHQQITDFWRVGKGYAKKLAQVGLYTMGDIAKFPAMKRDLSMTVSKDVFVGQIEAIIKKNGGKLLESVELFDVYEGNQIEKGKKSVAYSLTFRAKDRTLEEAEVNKVVDKILKKLSELGAELRS